MSRSYPTNDVGVWRMYCDSCDYVDPDRFDHAPPLEPFIEKGWFVGLLTDRCQACRKRTDLSPLRPHRLMNEFEAARGLL